MSFRAAYKATLCVVPLRAIRKPPAAAVARDSVVLVVWAQCAQASCRRAPVAQSMHHQQPALQAQVVAACAHDAAAGQEEG